MYLRSITEERDLGDIRNVCDKHETEKHAEEERKHRLRCLLKRRLTNSAANEESRAYRRRAESDSEVEDKYDAEMDRAHSECLYDRKQDRRHDHDERSHIHKASEDQEKQVDDQEEDIRIIRES